MVSIAEFEKTLINKHASMTALKEHKRNGNTKDKHTPLILILEKSMLI